MSISVISSHTRSNVGVFVSETSFCPYSSKIGYIKVRISFIGCLVHSMLIDVPFDLQFVILGLTMFNVGQLVVIWFTLLNRL